MLNTPPQSNKPTVAVVACGALAREIETLISINIFEHIVVKYLPAKLHNTPTEIPKAVAEALEELAPNFSNLFVAYGDCGTAGALDVVIEKYGATRLKGSHCYAFYAGLDEFEALQEDELGTFYLTDYLARQFDSLVFKPLGLDRNPELLETYFGNYTRLVYLAQSHDDDLDAKARDAADRLGLRFERVDTGFGMLEPALKSLASENAPA